MKNLSYHNTHDYGSAVSYASCPKNYKVDERCLTKNFSEVYEVCHQDGTPFYTLLLNNAPYSVGKTSTGAGNLGWSLEAKNILNESFRFTTLSEPSTKDLNKYLDDAVLDIYLNDRLIDQKKIICFRQAPRVK